MTKERMREMLRVFIGEARHLRNKLDGFAAEMRRDVDGYPDELTAAEQMASDIHNAIKKAEQGVSNA